MRFYLIVKTFWVRIRLIGTLLIFMIAMQPRVSSAGTSEPKMDYWFIQTLSLKEVDLPAGVEIITSIPLSQPRGLLVITNQSQALLFVMSLGYKSVLVMATPDPAWKARVNGAHEAASYLVAPDHPVHLSIEALTALDQNLVDRNPLRSDPPPVDLSIPAVQNSELLLVYGEQVIEVPFTLSYSLNVNFDNNTDANEQLILGSQATSKTTATASQQVKAAAEWTLRGKYLAIGLVGVTLLIIAGWLMWRNLDRRR